MLRSARVSRVHQTLTPNSLQSGTIIPYIIGNFLLAVNCLSRVSLITARECFEQNWDEIRDDGVSANRAPSSENCDTPFLNGSSAHLPYSSEPMQA